MTKVWLEAGYESARVDMSARQAGVSPVAKAGEASGGLAQTNTRHQRCRHPIRGALRDITFVPPGVDLTEPADHEWAASARQEIRTGNAVIRSMSPLLLDTNAAIWLSRDELKASASEKLDGSRPRGALRPISRQLRRGRSDFFVSRNPLEPRHNTAALVRPYPRNAERTSGRIVARHPDRTRHFFRAGRRAIPHDRILLATARGSRPQRSVTREIS